MGGYKELLAAKDHYFYMSFLEGPCTIAGQSSNVNISQWENMFQ